MPAPGFLDDVSQQQQNPPPPPDPTQGLEQVAANAPGQLAQSLQNQLQPSNAGAPPQNQPGPQQQPGQNQQQQPQQPGQPDQWDTLKQGLMQQYQQNLAESQKGGRIKNLLGNFIGNMAGLPSPLQKSQADLQNLMSVSNAQAMDTYRQAQTQSLQMVQRTLPDGSVVSMPANDAAKVDAATIHFQAQKQGQQFKTNTPAGMYGERLAYLLQNGQNPDTDPLMAQIAQAQQTFTAKATPTDNAAAAHAQFSTLIGKMQQRGALPPDYLQSPQHLSAAMQQAGQKGILTPDEVQAGVGYLATYPTPGATAANVNVKVQAAAANQAATQDRTPVYAYDPQQKQTVLTTGSAAAAGGMLGVRKVAESDISKDTHDSKVLNDVAAKANRVIETSPALDQGPGQVEVVASALAAAEKDSNFRAGAFGTEIPTGWLNSLLNRENLGAATPQTKDYIIAVLSARESAMGMQKVLTGSARASETQISALLQTLPGNEPDSATARKKMAAFTQNIEILRQGIPKLPGVETVPINLNPQAQQQQNSGPTVTDPRGIVHTFRDQASADNFRRLANIR